MIVKTTAWHYKFLKFMDFTIPKTNCGYYSSICIALLLLTVVLFMGYIASTLVGFVVLEQITGGFDSNNFIIAPLIGVITIPLVIALCACTFLGSLYILCITLDKVVTWYVNSGNPIVTKFKRLKQKICKDIEIT